MALNKRIEKGSKLTYNEVDANWTQIENWLAGKAALNHTHSIANVAGLQIALDARMLNSQRGVANGVASLGSDGKVPTSQLPNLTGSGMYFPHTTLTGADVGKLVILKDGKAQLPVFESPVPAKIDFELNLDSAIDFTPDVLTITFLSNPVDGDYIKIGGFKHTFRTVVTLNYEILLGADIDETIANIMSNNDLLDMSYSLSTPSSEVLEVARMYTGRYGYFQFEEDLFNEEISSPFATFSNSFVSVQGRLGTVLVPFLFIWGLGLIDEVKYEAFASFYQINPNFSLVLIEDDFGLCNFPTSLEEIKTGIKAYLDTLPQVTSAFWADNILKLVLAGEFPKKIKIDAGDEIYWQDASKDGTETKGLPIYCKHPILGLVKNVTPSQVEIYTEPICEFKSTYDEIVEWDTLMNISRCFILDPENAGYLKPLISIEIGSLDTLFIVASAGYVTALDKSIGANSSFLGAFSLDLFALQVLYLLLNSEDEGGG